MFLWSSSGVMAFVYGKQKNFIFWLFNSKKASKLVRPPSINGSWFHPSNFWTVQHNGTLILRMRSLLMNSQFFQSDVIIAQCGSECSKPIKNILSTFFYFFKRIWTVAAKYLKTKFKTNTSVQNKLVYHLKILTKRLYV